MKLVCTGSTDLQLVTWAHYCTIDGKLCTQIIKALMRSDNGVKLDFHLNRIMFVSTLIATCTFIVFHWTTSNNIMLVSISQLTVVPMVAAHIIVVIVVHQCVVHVPLPKIVKVKTRLRELKVNIHVHIYSTVYIHACYFKMSI